VDERIYFFLYGGDARTSATLAMIGFSWLGSGWMMLLLVPLLVAKQTRRLAATLGTALVVLAIAVWAIKHLVHRVRPYATLGTSPPIAPPTDFSFPSGHAAGSFAVAGFVVAVCASVRFRGRAAIAVGTVALAAAIAFSRVYLGVHYPGDVAGGAVIGSLAGLAAGRWYCSKGQTSSTPSLAAKPPFDPN